ncbi:hypothetical protein GLOTRDRAFT_36273 [Gloeophyllum trabeum ATCC 11539]|uniref:Fe2OG dioxygenase domain-containing protein n=1 Tax=Gloeophyllum trabeum (strain ATCC 11539 / FP-39264 / Madison 617) TaxID=670483 RepID=S7QG20_GLOTA|nr:uncharacterized protein GLOTRDRAFT_36273 [Gloeophyllum trabeum ATCC 11539]EPQ58372.1 hypothetical protein GLOTRDRAFT_36273 [Gloeophyllum trabeum ATCC 11539]
MTVLRPPPSPAKDTPRRLPPLTLANPDMVAKHTPCTLHLSVLPPELACRLFYTMLDESQEWKRNQWWLFERLVESPHRTSFYVRRFSASDGDSEDVAGDAWQEAAQYWYNGRSTQPPRHFPDVLEEACTIVERVVNEEMKKRRRYPLEWGGDSLGIWRANVAAANCYEGAKESVGAHADQLTYLGPYPTIASISLGTTRTFRLRETIPSDQRDVRQARTFNIPLPHNSLTIMHASTQERFKHSIPPQSTIDLYRPSYPRSMASPIEPSNCRINITFRFYRPDFHPSTIPRCKCGIPTVLRADQKNKQDGSDKYWWHCNAAAQNEGKDCGFWKVLDIKAEGRGPCVQDALEDSAG